MSHTQTTTKQIANLIPQLRAAYGSIHSIDPTGPSYQKLVTLLDSVDRPTLQLLADAKIPWVSSLAYNRLPVTTPGVCANCVLPVRLCECAK